MTLATTIARRLVSGLALVAAIAAGAAQFSRPCLVPMVASGRGTSEDARWASGHVSRI
jgi:hypothetical protein